MAINEAELKIVLRAVGTELIQAMDQVRSSVDRATGQVKSQFQETEKSVNTSVGAIRERVTVGFSGIQGSIRAFGEIAQVALAVLAAERAVRDIIAATQDWANTNEHLHTALGASFEDTATFAVAVKEAGASLEQIDTLVQGLVRKINQQQQLSFGKAPIDELKQVGLSVRDASGNLLPFITLLERARNVIDEYRAGADQLAVAQRIFGRGASAETLEALRKTIDNFDHARQIVRDFGLELDENGIVQARAFTRATADLGLAFTSVETILGQELRPEIEKVINKVVELARDGSLQEWARNAADDVVGLGDDIVTLTEFLIDNEAAIKAAAAAWIIYKASLLASGEASEVVAILGKVQAAITAVQVAQGGRIAVFNLATGISQAGVAAAEFNATAVAASTLGGELKALAPAAEVAAEAIAEGGKATVAAVGGMSSLTAAAYAAYAALGATGLGAVILALGAAVVTYEGKWGALRQDVEDLATSMRDHLKPEALVVFDGFTKLKELWGELDEPLQTLKSDFESIANSLERIGVHIPSLPTAGEALKSFLTSLPGVGPLIAIDDALQKIERRQHPEKFFGEFPSPLALNELTRLSQTPTSASLLPLGPGELTPAPGTKKAPPTDADEERFAKEKFDALEKAQAAELASVEHNEAAKFEIIKKYNAQILAIGRLTLQERETQAKIYHEAELRVFQERKEFAELDEKTRFDTLNRGLDTEKTIREQQRKAGLLTEVEKLQDFAGIEDRRLALVQDHYERELRFQISNEETLADVRRRLAEASTPEEQQDIFKTLPGVDPRKVLADLNGIQAAVEKHANDIKAIQFDIDDTLLKQKAEEIRGVFDAVFGDIQTAVGSFVQTLVNGSQSAASGIAALRVELRNSQQDMAYAAATSGRLSDAFIQARQREVDAQDRLNNTIKQQSVLQQAAADATKQFYTQAVSQATGFLLEILKLQALEVIGNALKDEKILDADKLTGTERLAYLAGNKLFGGAASLVGGGGTAAGVGQDVNSLLGNADLFSQPGTGGGTTPAAPTSTPGIFSRALNFVGLGGLFGGTSTPAPGTGLPIPLPVVVTNLPEGGGLEGALGLGAGPAGAGSAGVGGGGAVVQTALTGAQQVESIASESQQRQTEIFQQGETQRAGILGHSLLGQLVLLTVHTAQALGRWIAHQFAMSAAAIKGESQRTGAAVLGQSERTAAEEAGQAAHEAIQVQKAITDKKSVIGDAAAAAAHVFKSLTEQFGWIGAIVGAAAAAGVFVAVAAFGDSISAEGGADIGGDGAVALLHPREMVLPADLAQGVRDITKPNVVPPRGGPSATSVPRLSTPTTSSTEPQEVIVANTVPVELGNESVKKLGPAPATRGSSPTTKAPQLPSFAVGGEIPEDMQAYVHEGEWIVSKAQKEAILAVAGRASVDEFLRLDVEGPRLRGPSVSLRPDAEVDTSLIPNRDLGDVAGERQVVVHLSAPITIKAVDGADAKNVFERNVKHLTNAMSRAIAHRPGPRRQP